MAAPLQRHATGTEAYGPCIFHSDANGRTTGPAIDGWVGGAALGLSSVETLVAPRAITSSSGRAGPWTAPCSS